MDILISFCYTCEDPRNSAQEMYEVWSKGLSMIYAKLYGILCCEGFWLLLLYDLGPHILDLDYWSSIRRNISKKYDKLMSHRLH